jgi:hypothetical protein
VLAENARTEVQRLESAIANLKGEAAWRTKYESPETYDALIYEQRNKTDRGANIWTRTKNCTDTTLKVSEEVCTEIARLTAQKANAIRRQVILSELKTLGAQLVEAKAEVETHKKVSNPALAQVRSITTWFNLDRSPTDHSDFWGAKSIMLYMTILLTALICVLGWELGQYRPIIEPPAPKRPRNRWIAAENHPPEAIPLRAEPAPPVSPSGSTVHVTSYTTKARAHDHEALQRLMRELEEDFGLEPRH